MTTCLDAWIHCMLCGSERRSLTRVSPVPAPVAPAPPAPPPSPSSHSMEETPLFMVNLPNLQNMFVRKV